MSGIRRTSDLGTFGSVNIVDGSVVLGTDTTGNYVATLTGTTNQVSVSASTGNVTLSTPQNIHTGASPSFAGVTVTGTISSGISVLNRASATAWNAGSMINLQVDGTTYVTLGVDATNSALKSSGSFSTPTTSASAFGDHGFSNFWRPVDAYNNSYFKIGTGSFYVDSANYYFRNASSTNNLTIDTSGNTGVRGALNAYSISGNSNVAGTGNASYHPSGIYSTGATNWLYGNLLTNGGTIGASSQYCGAMYSNNWFRSAGQTGIYNESYGGGIYMIDSTWVRTYNNKNFYCDAEIRSNNPFSSNGPNNGIYVRLNSSNQGSFSWVSPNFWFIVDGSLVKTFVIDHPTKQDNWLVHACAEGPTSDVFYRGEGQLENGFAVISLPDYFEDLTEKDGRTIQITPIADDTGNAANLAVYPISNGKFTVEQTGGYINKTQKFYWRVDAVRKNTSFEVEPLRSTVDVHGTGPYTYLTKKE